MKGIWGIYLLSWLILLLLGYFLGCLNGSVMVSHFVIRDDVRQHGSGNAGLTNFYRTYGAKYALGVILFDMGKTVVACTNLKPRKMMGIMSNGMLISAVKEEPDGTEKLHLIILDDKVPAGYGLC